jgi:hypothetical protein
MPIVVAQMNPRRFEIRRNSDGMSMVHSSDSLPPSSFESFAIDAQWQHVPWFEPDRHLKLVGAPPDIVPFLGLHAYSVAGQIFWFAIAYIYSAIKALVGPSPPPDAHVVASSVFGLALRNFSLPNLLAILHGRLLFRKQGWIAGDHDGRNADPTKALFSSPLDTYGPLLTNTYRDASDVENHLREKLGSNFATFEATLRGQQGVQQTSLMKGLMTVLARSAICFGDGPRWKLDLVGAIANRWMEESGIMTVS